MLLKFYLKKTQDETNKSKWSCLSTISGYHSRTIYSVKWSKLNNLIATAGSDNKIHIFKETASNVMDESKLGGLSVLHVENDAHTQDCNCIDWHPTQENILASASDDGTIKIWHFTHTD